MNKAFIFDLDDTLYLRSIPYINAYNSCFKDRFIIDENELLKVSRDEDQISFTQLHQGLINEKEMYLLRVIRTLKHFGYEINEDEAWKFHQIYTDNLMHASLQEGMIDVLTFLKEKNCFIGIITNGSTDRQLNKIKNLKLTNWIPLENILVSQEINIQKPDQRIFEYYQNIHMLDVSNAWYIGDNYLNDIVGPKQKDWKTIWLKRSYIPQPQTINEYPDYSCDNEEELLNIIKEIIK